MYKTNTSGAPSQHEPEGAKHEGRLAPTRAHLTLEMAAAPTTARAPATATASPDADHHHPRGRAPEAPPHQLITSSMTGLRDAPLPERIPLTTGLGFVLAAKIGIVSCARE